MGEAKRKRAAMTPYEQMLVDLTKKLTDDGLLIEAGWIGFRKVWLKPEAPDELVTHCRMAFMAGATHFYFSIMSIMDPGTEPTDTDYSRMKKIHDELERFNNELKVRLPAEGSA